MVVVLVGTGWSLMRPLIGDREKRILMVVIPLQVRSPLASHPIDLECEALAFRKSSSLLLLDKRTIQQTLKLVPLQLGQSIALGVHAYLKLSISESGYRQRVCGLTLEDISKADEDLHEFQWTDWLSYVQP